MSSVVKMPLYLHIFRYCKPLVYIEYIHPLNQISISTTPCWIPWGYIGLLCNQNTLEYSNNSDKMLYAGLVIYSVILVAFLFHNTEIYKSDWPFHGHTATTPYVFVLEFPRSSFSEIIILWKHISCTISTMSFTNREWHYSDVAWASRRLESPAGKLFV